MRFSSTLLEWGKTAWAGCIGWVWSLKQGRLENNTNSDIFTVSLKGRRKNVPTQARIISPQIKKIVLLLMTVLMEWMRFIIWPLTPGSSPKPLLWSRPHPTEKNKMHNRHLIWYMRPSGIALCSTRPQVQDSNPRLGKVYSTFHPFIGSIKWGPS